MKLILDTHILLYAANNNLDEKRKTLISDPDHELCFSVISLWEISKLHQLGRIRITGPLESFLDLLCNHPSYSAVALNPKSLAYAIEIAPRMHKDPADQIIVAEAICQEAVLLTNDKLIKGLEFVHTM